MTKLPTPNNFSGSSPKLKPYLQTTLPSSLNRPSSEPTQAQTAHGFSQWNNPALGLQRLEQRNPTSATERKAKELKIPHEENVHRLLRQLGVSQAVIDKGTFKKEDIPNPMHQEFLQAFLLICENKTEQYGRGAHKNKCPKGFNKLESDTLTKEKAQLALSLLKEYPDKIKILFSQPSPLAENRRQSAMILENIITNPERIPELAKNKMYYLTQNKRQLCTAQNRTISDFESFGFKGYDLAGIFFSRVTNPRLLQAGSSVGKITTEGTTRHGAKSGKIGASVLVKDASAPGGVKILSAVHVVDRSEPSTNYPDYFKSIDDITFTIDDTTYNVDLDRIKHNPSDGDYIELYLSAESNPPDLSALATPIAQKAPYEEEVFAIGFPLVEGQQGKKYYSTGNHSTYMSVDEKDIKTPLTRKKWSSNLVGNSGNSGGGLFNKAGELIGINFGIPRFKDVQGKVQISEKLYYMSVIPDEPNTNSTAQPPAQK